MMPSISDIELNDSRAATYNFMYSNWGAFSSACNAASLAA